VEEPVHQQVEAVFKEVAAVLATTGVLHPKRPRLTELMDRESPLPPPPLPMLTIRDSKVRTEIGNSNEAHEHFFFSKNEE